MSISSFGRGGPDSSLTLPEEVLQARSGSLSNHGHMDKSPLTVGGELRFHDGRHIGSVIAGDPLPPGTPNPATYYDYHPRTLAAGLYARWEWNLPHALRATSDASWRHAGYAMRGAEAPTRAQWRAARSYCGVQAGLWRHA